MTKVALWNLCAILFVSTLCSTAYPYSGGTGTADVRRLCADGADYPKLNWQFLNRAIVPARMEWASTICCTCRADG